MNLHHAASIAEVGTRLHGDGTLRRTWGVVGGLRGVAGRLVGFGGPELQAGLPWWAVGTLGVGLGVGGTLLVLRRLGRLKGMV